MFTVDILKGIHNLIKLARHHNRIFNVQGKNYNANNNYLTALYTYILYQHFRLWFQ